MVIYPPHSFSVLWIFLNHQPSAHPPSLHPWILSILIPMCSLSLLCSCKNHLIRVSKTANWCFPFDLFFPYPVHPHHTPKRISTSLTLPPVFWWVPPSPNQTTSLISLPLFKHVLLHLLLLLSYRSLLTLLTTHSCEHIKQSNWFCFIKALRINRDIIDVAKACNWGVNFSKRICALFEHNILRGNTLKKWGKYSKRVSTKYALVPF